MRLTMVWVMRGGFELVAAGGGGARFRQDDPHVLLATVCEGGPNGGEVGWVGDVAEAEQVWEDVVKLIFHRAPFG